MGARAGQLGTRPSVRFYHVRRTRVVRAQGGPPSVGHVRGPWGRLRRAAPQGAPVAAPRAAVGAVWSAPAPPRRGCGAAAAAAAPQPRAAAAAAEAREGGPAVPPWRPPVACPRRSAHGSVAAALRAADARRLGGAARDRRGGGLERTAVARARGRALEDGGPRMSPSREIKYLLVPLRAFWKENKSKFLVKVPSVMTGVLLLSDCGRPVEARKLIVSLAFPNPLSLSCVAAHFMIHVHC